MYRIVVTKGKSWYWKLIRNGRILATSEMYSARRKANKTAYKLLESFKQGHCTLVEIVSV